MDPTGWHRGERSTFGSKSVRGWRCPCPLCYVQEDKGEPINFSGKLLVLQADK